MAEQARDATRPFGVYAIIILQSITVLAFLVQTVKMPRGILSLLLIPFTDPRVLNMLTALIVVLLLINIAGLWWLQRWAWFATMILTGLSLLFGIVQYFQGVPSYMQMVIDLFIVLYLNQRNVQRCFERRREMEVVA
ncbi:MAG: hypothetical protein M3220_06815 [Chloroflexota bacterium]|nr:hypothetical protein [Chloroflexota bacterium]